MVESKLRWHDFLLYKCSNMWIRVRRQGLDLEELQKTLSNCTLFQCFMVSFSG